jgi:hypothetical protein
MAQRHQSAHERETRRRRPGDDQIHPPLPDADHEHSHECKRLAQPAKGHLLPAAIFLP